MPADVPRYRLLRTWAGLPRGSVVSPYGRIERELLAAGWIEPLEETPAPEARTAAPPRRPRRRKRKAG